MSPSDATPPRSNCLWAWRRWRREGGYFVIRRSHYGRWWHFLWIPPGSPEMLAYVPLDAVDPAEWQQWPWWQQLMWWRIWKGRPSDLFWFEGQVTQETPHPALTKEVSGQ